MIHNVHPTHIQRLNPSHGTMPHQSTNHRHMAHPSHHQQPKQQQQPPPPPPSQQHQQQHHQQGPPPPHLNKPMNYVPSQQPMKQASVEQTHIMHKSQNYHPNRSNQHYHHPHHHHQSHRANGGNGGAIPPHSMHPNRQNYHNGHAGSGGGKASYPYHTNPSATINENSRVTILSKPPSQHGNASTARQSNENTVYEEPPLAIASEEKKFDVIVASHEPSTKDCDNGTESTGKSANNKTAMCLVNELVRSNHLKFQYLVINEQGAAHDKMFTIRLELGDEKYEATGKSIKQAQQEAAANALKLTKHTRPSGRQQRSTFSRKKDIDRPIVVSLVTPTVQLNSMAMKRGILVSYSVHYPRSYHDLAAKVRMANEANKYRLQNNAGTNNGANPNSNQNNNPKPNPDPNHNNRNHKNNQNNNQNNNNNVIRGGVLDRHRTTEDDPYRVIAQLGNELSFNGEGLTLQLAKHDAATKAIAHLKAEAMNSSTDGSEHSRVNESTENSDDTGADLLKSAISIVQEVAQKRDLSVRFAVESEKGPAHMKHFIISCTVGEITTSGEGNSKKVAKKHAAEAMVIELQKLPPLPSQQPSPPQSGRRVGRVSKRSIPNSNNLATAVPAIPPRRRKPKNLIKEFVSNDDTSTTSTSATEDEVTNPISRLLRMQQAARKREPIYTVIEERGQAKRKEFVVEVECNDEKAQGIGPNKKLAKRTAAENYLIKMGLLTPEASEVDSTKSPPGGKVQRRVIFKEPETPIVQTSPGGSAGRQLVPGVLLMNSPDNLAFKATSSNDDIGSKATSTDAPNQSSPAVEASNSDCAMPEDSACTNPTNPAPPSVSGGIRPVNQLLYLAKLLKFEVHFSDFPKGNHSDYLTLASLTTDPPQMFHGSGNSLDASKDQAALSALKTISELGLDNIRTPQANDPMETADAKATN